MTNHEMDRFNEAVEQLADLIKDRKSFIDGDAEHDDVFMADIKALEDAIIGIKELQDLKRKQESGLLVELPIPIGSKVNFIDKFNNDEVYKQAIISGIGLFWTNETDIGDYIPLSVIGKTVIPFYESEVVENGLD